MRHLKKFWSWLRWEFSRKVEIGPVIRVIIAERLVKALVLIGGGILIYIVAKGDTASRMALEIHDQLDLRPGRHFFRSSLEFLLSRFGELSLHKQTAIAAAAFLYGLLDATQAVGLWMRRRWAEYLVLVATSMFLPLEAWEIHEHFTLIKILVLIANLAIIVYLIWKKRLFLDRRGHAHGED